MNDELFEEMYEGVFVDEYGVEHRIVSNSPDVIKEVEGDSR